MIKLPLKKSMKTLDFFKDFFKPQHIVLSNYTAQNHFPPTKKNYYDQLPYPLM